MIQKIIYIVGPTASGKTYIANNLAINFNLPVLSMDSMQIYSRLDIGTSKPTKEELEKIQYFGINIIDPDSYYSAADYINYARNIVETRNDKAIIIVGGTGLYYDGLTEGFSKIPPQNTKIRKDLYSICEKEGVEKLYKILEEIDKSYSEKITKNDAKRIVRALEVYQITGKPFSSFHLKKDIAAISDKALKFGIIMPRFRLYERIDKRVDSMFQSGLLDETERLYIKFKDENIDLPSLKALGYQDIFDFFSGKISLDKAKENIKKRTRNYAKRQITWFKRDKDIKWLYLLKEDELDVAKNISFDNLQLIKKKRKKSRQNYINLETELVEFILSFNNFEFIGESKVIEYLKDILNEYIKGK